MDRNKITARTSLNQLPISAPLRISTPLRISVPLRSVPGIYLWTDCAYLRGYRLQEHYSQARYRLLDASGRCLCVGTRDSCHCLLAELRQRESLELPTGPVIVLLHGMARNAWTMLPLARYLQQQWPEAEVVNFQYASTCGPVLLHARRLVDLLQYTDQASEVHFVGHSLGNIVMRRAFKLAEQGEARMPGTGRMVMLGPPNQGSQIAAKLQGLVPLAWFNGAPFRQLGGHWSEFVHELAIPACPFGIVAGSVPWVHRIHPLLRGPSDLIVSVEETRLPGAADFMTVPIGHTWLMSSRRVQQATLNFLRTGRFASAHIP